MISKILVAGMLFGAAPLMATTPANEEVLRAVQELYDYSTRAVQVEPAKVQEMVGKIDARLGSPEGDAAQAYEQLKAEAQKDQPDGRELRVYARTLYRALTADQAATEQAAAGEG